MKNQKFSDEDEEIVDESRSSTDTEIEADYLDVEQNSRMTNSVSRKRRSRKKTSQKNAIKQRIAKILKRFKEPEEDNVGENNITSDFCWLSLHWQEATPLQASASQLPKSSKLFSKN